MSEKAKYPLTREDIYEVIDKRYRDADNDDTESIPFIDGRRAELKWLMRFLEIDMNKNPVINTQAQLATVMARNAELETALTRIRDAKWNKNTFNELKAIATKALENKP